MNKVTKTIFLLGTVVALVGCSSNSDSDAVRKVVSYPGIKQLRAADEPSDGRYENFSEHVDFLKQMDKFSSKASDKIIWENYVEGKNFAMSPYSLELCLGLAARCANGKTRQEIMDAMGMDYDMLKDNYPYFFRAGSFTEKTNTGDVSSISLPNNSIWLNKGIKFKEDCLDDLKSSFYCDSFSADFANKNKEANKAIKEYISQKTKGLIAPDLDLSPVTLFVLMNTIYIKDVWNDSGSDLTYADESYKFKNYNGEYSSKRLLSGYSFSGRAYSGEDYSSFFTRTNNSFTITFIKPNEGKTLREVFNEKTINETRERVYQTKDEEKMERYYTQCIFPEYEAEADIDLVETFINDFNVKSLFSSACDFSNITDNEAYCEDFKQIAKLKVKKNGVEGAAVTYMAVCGATAPDNRWTDVYEKFVLDKEFGFILSGSQGVVFSGVVTNID